MTEMCGGAPYVYERYAGEIVSHFDGAMTRHLL